MDRLTETEAFSTVVDQGGFTVAARKMGISNLPFRNIFPVLKHDLVRDC